ncbi:MAG: efflux RND transporter permease subunit [Candidatus Melainabacteria bacterium]|nr:efflux RND transporter permease subunit [Candidatus Melainabacteria bacterium]
MISKVIEFSLKQKFVIIVMSMMLAAWGIVSFLNIPIEAFPDVTDTMVQIITQYPGKASEEVEKQITLPIETELNGLPHTTQIRSRSLSGLSVIDVIFDDTVEKYFARQLVLERLRNVNLPDEADVDLGPLSTPIGEIYRYTLESNAHSSMELRTIQEWFMKRNLKRVPGVADVVNFGGKVRQFQVLVDPLKLKSFGLTLQDIFDALAFSNKNTGGGYLKIDNERYIVRGIGLLTSVNDIHNTVIKAVNGTPVKIFNIGTAQIGPAVRQGIVGRNRKNDVVEGIVLMRRAENPSRVLADVKAKLVELQDMLPKGVKIVRVYDREELINRTLENVRSTLLIGGILVFVILMIFTGQKTLAGIVTLIVPLALLFAFILMRFGGVSANLLSLGAIDFGIIIDGAVVMAETIFVALVLQHGSKDRVSLIAKAGAQVGKPIMFAKTIIIIAFLPLFALQRVEGRLFEPLALTMSFAVFGALFFTLTLVPVLCSIFIKDGIQEKEIWIVKQIEKFYMPVLYWSIQRPKRVLLIATYCLCFAIFFVPFLGTEFLPEVDEGAIWIRATMPIDISIDDAHAMAPRIIKKIRSFPQVKTTVYQIGRPEDATDPNLQNNTEIFVDLIPRQKWGCTKEQLIEKLDNVLEMDFPGIAFNFSQPIADNVDEAISGVKGQVAIKLFGPSLRALLAKAKEIYKVTSKITGVTDSFVDQLTGQPELLIKIDRDLCSRYGIRVGDVQNIIETALAGKVATQFIEEEKRFDLVVRLLPEYRSDVETIKSLQIDSADGTKHVPIAQLATFKKAIGAPIIYRENNKRRAAVRFNVRKRDMGGLVAEAQRLVNKKVKMPKGYSIVWSGQFESQQRAMKRLYQIAPLSVLFILILLFADFGSLRNALLILITIPLAAIGGILGLFFTHIHLSVSAAVGFIALSGVSVQNGIILVSVFNRLRQEGHELKIAIVQGVKQRLRPVIMTALLASMGLLPAALSTGTGSETQKPFAVVIVFGMISAVVLTLVVLPALYGWFESRGKKQEA